MKQIIDQKVKPASETLVSINEKEERDAQKAFYEKIEAEMCNKKMKKLKFWHRVSIVYAPVCVLTFMSIYWFAGMRHAGIL